MFDKGEGSIELPEDVENSLLDAVWTMRWTENKESMKLKRNEYNRTWHI
jgi:hypothetical protein